MVKAMMWRAQWKVILIAAVAFAVAPLAVAAPQVVIPEEVRARCVDRPTSERVMLAVARFSQSTDGNSAGNIANFSTMLSNAMFEIDCFRMLSMLEDMNWSFGSNDDEDAIRPHMIVTGEITEYNHTTEETGNFLRKKTIVTAHLGFVLQIKDPVTREIFFSKSFNQVGSSENSSMQFDLGGVGLSSSSDEPVDKAYFDAFEKGILDAVTYIVDSQGQIYEIAGSVLAETAAKAAEKAADEAAEAALSTTKFTVRNVDFLGLKNMEDLLKGNTSVSLVEKTLSGNTGTLTVRHLGTADDLLGGILSALGGGVEVTGFDDEGVELTLK
jgi:hypothetical protein